MARISQVDYAGASAEQKAAHDGELALRGRMTNMKRTLLHSPVALQIYGEWFALRDELRPVLGDRAIWIFAHAICVASGSVVGTGFMRRALVQGGDDPDALNLDEKDRLLTQFGTALGRDPKGVGDEIWDALSMHYSEKTLVDLVAFAGIMIATNVFTDAVGTEIDVELREFLGQASGPAPAEI